MTDIKALVERCDMIVAELQGLPHVTAAVAEAAAALRDLTDWRDIAAAPKDGDAILISRPTHFMDEEGWHVVRWDADAWTCHDGKFDTPLRGPDPTHWLPLPSAPNLKETGE